MGDKTNIEWTDATWNPIRARQVVPGAAFAPKVGWHCEHVSEGCRNCYAEGINKRLGTRVDFKPGHRSDIEIFLDEKMLMQPLRWKRARTIFVNSMSDTFADFVRDEWIDRVFAVMALCPQHRFQVLTKRAKRMREYIDALASEWTTRLARCADGMRPGVLRPDPHNQLLMRNYGPFPLPHVWLGVSAEDQERADERIPELLATPAAVRFVSLEPLLGEIELEGYFGTLRIRIPRNVTPIKPTASSAPLAEAIAARGGSIEKGERGLDWVIVGGESGPHARPMHPDWARSVRDQCVAAGVPFFYKQHGEFIGVPDLRRLPGGEGPGFGKFDHCQYDERHEAIRVGKKRAGRLLDGVEHNEFPTPR